MNVLHWLYVAFTLTLLLVGVVGLCRYYAIRSNPRQEELARQSFEIGGSATLIFLILLFLSQLTNEVLSTIVRISIFSWLFLALWSLVLSTTTLFMGIFYFIRFDPEKEEVARQAYSIGTSAGLILLLLIFLSPLVFSD